MIHAGFISSIHPAGVCQPSAAQRGSHYILFFWARSRSRRGWCTLTVCVSERDVLRVCSLSRLIQLVGFHWRWLTFYSLFFLSPPRRTLMFHHFFNLHHLLLFVSSSVIFPVNKSAVSQTLPSRHSSSPPVLHPQPPPPPPLLPPPPLSTPVTAGWSCGAMCQAWPRVFLDGSWPSRAEPPASHDCLFSAHQPSLPLVLS